MAYTYDFPHPAVATDAVVFTVCDARLEVLLIQRKHEPFAGLWAFPGGFLDYDEDLLDCAKRELEEETGVRGVKLEQFYAAGKPGRDPRERNISIVHLALVRAEKVRPKAADDAAAVGWFNAHRPPPLAFDHRELLARARKHIADKIRHTPAALALLPRRFTLSQLKSVYEAVLGKPLKERDFLRMMRSLDCIQATRQYARDGRGTARLYEAKTGRKV